MTLKEAFAQLILTEDYRTKSKPQGSDGRKYRMYASRFKKGELKSGAIVEMLLANGYEIKANKVRKAK